jgi:TonB family protein
MDALSRWVLTFLLNSIWQVTLVIGATALVDLCLRRAPARYRHALWVVSLVVAIVLPVASTLETRIKSPRANAALQVPILAYVPFSVSPDSTVIVHATARRTQLSRIRNLLVAGAHPSIAVPRPAGRGVLTIYASFLTFMLLRFARAWLRARSIRRLACNDSLPAHAVSTLERCRRAMTRSVAQTCFSRSAAFLQMCVRPAKAADLEKQVCAARALNPAILWSEQTPGPLTVGALRGAIILPTNLREEGAAEDLEAALAHEMAHVCRFDYLCNLICELLLLPIAFHPLTWLLRRRLAEARELACDELAAQVLDSSQYARSLVRIANQISSRVSAALKLDYTLGVFDANILEERVMTLLKPRASGRLAQLSILLGSLVIVSSCLLAARFSLAVGQASTTSSVTTASAGNQVTKYPGILNGVSGGVSGGVPGGVAGGLVTMPSGARAQEAAQAGDNSLSGIVVDNSGAPAQEAAQAGDNSVSGIVVDIRGARVPKATVWLVNRDSAARQDAETDETGGFAFKDLPAGRYTLNVMSPGMGGSFYMFTLKAEGEPPFFPFVLQPGALAESVVVTAKLPRGVSTARPGTLEVGTSAGPRRIRIGGSVEIAKLIENTPQPVYPESARERGIQGVVMLEATISAEGVPTDLKVLSSPSEDLSKAAMDAVQQWKYRSTLLNGEPIAVVTTIAVDFRLEE